MISFHWIDLKNIWKIKGVNFGYDFNGWNNGFKKVWFHFEYWTPKWHENRGPYIIIAIGKLKLMRGY